MTLQLSQIKDDFYSRTKFSGSKADEDNVKLGTYSEILSPLIKEFIPNYLFDSETTYFKGGRSDGTISGLVFEYKKSHHFDKESGVDEALYGRNGGKSDSGLYSYLIDEVVEDAPGVLNDTLFDTNGVGFDGFHWIFARFVPTPTANEIDVTNTRFATKNNSTMQFNAGFTYHVVDFDSGLKELVTLIKSMDKIALTKDNLTNVFRPASSTVRDTVLALYAVIDEELHTKNSSKRVITLYDEWLMTFGAMFGEDDQNTEFNETAESIASLYNLNNSNLDPKMFLFALQTYFNIVLKLLISNFLTQAKSPVAILPTQMDYMEIANLFEGKNDEATVVANFFEVHYYEWFTFVDTSHVEQVTEAINTVLSQLQEFDMGTFTVRPESMHDVLQEVYMNLIPEKVRHLLGEYFSPDWIVEFVLDRIGYSEQELGSSIIDKKIIDPTAGSGAFLLQALKRLISASTSNAKPLLSAKDLDKITSNVVGFDLNPISSISAKANYILSVLSVSDFNDISEPINIPVYITDSVLAPVVYSEENTTTFTAKTSVGDFVIPKFDSFKAANEFMTELSKAVDLGRKIDVFWSLARAEFNIDESQENIIKNLYLKLSELHRAGQDSFWPRILKNSFAPVLLKQRFDFVVGNPPWIAWKAMSKTYREGTLKVWQSYGIFEKSAYDKKTTHDDFGMAVTYVALDQYLKNNGKLMFLLPKTFIKSTKGGEGFRKFSITRNEQDIPVKVLEVDDFNDIKIFQPKHTVSTMALLLQKNAKNKFPMSNWNSWNYVGKSKLKFNAHDTWAAVSTRISNTKLDAQPVDLNDPQTAWLSMPPAELSLAQKALSNGSEPVYHARKGIEPAGAKGVYILKKPVVNKNNPKLVDILNDMDRQRRPDLKSQGAQPGTIEPTYIFPMLGGRNIHRWSVDSSEFILVPHDEEHIYGLSDEELAENAPRTYKWLEYYKQGLYDSRVQNGKFFNPDIHPWYRLDNIGPYTYSKYKVLWKEQTSSFAAVAVGPYSQSVPDADLSLIGGVDKPVVVDSKVLLLATDSFEEALFVAGVLNSPSIRDIIDSYAVALNRGTDVVDYIKLPKFDPDNDVHKAIVQIARDIQTHIKTLTNVDLTQREAQLDSQVKLLFA